MKKKIGILTYHHVINEGAILQALALVSALKKIFPDSQVEIIDYRSKKAELDYLVSAFKQRTIAAIPHTVSRYFRLKRFINNNLPLSKQRLVSDNYEASLAFIKKCNYDLIVVGSDEVWKVVDGRFSRVFPNIYWLGDGLKAKKVSFAASANRTNCAKISNKNREWMRKRLADFDYISVRDDSTLSFVRSLVPADRDLFKVSDPTFMLDMEVGVGISVRDRMQRLGVDFSSKVVGILLGDRSINSIICKHLNQTGCFTVGLSFYAEQADVNLCGKLDPVEWAHAIKQLNFCVTDRFHGVLFCLKNKIPFIALEKVRSSDKNEGKIKCLLTDFELLDSYIETRDHAIDMGLFDQRMSNVDFGEHQKRITANALIKKQLCMDVLSRLPAMINV